MWFSSGSGAHSTAPISICNCAAADLTTIILCGIATEFGVESTARDAHERGYELIFAEDAMTGQSAESHANSVERIFPRLGRVRSTEEILAALSR